MITVKNESYYWYLRFLIFFSHASQDKWQPWEDMWAAIFRQTSFLFTADDSNICWWSAYVLIKSMVLPWFHLNSSVPVVDAVVAMGSTDCAPDCMSLPAHSLRQLTMQQW